MMRASWMIEMGQGKRRGVQRVAGRCITGLCVLFLGGCSSGSSATPASNDGGIAGAAPDDGGRNGGGVAGSDDSTMDDASSHDGDSDCVVGDEACACYPNDTCNGTLSCYSHLCVDVSPAGDTGGSSAIANGDGGVASTAGSSVIANETGGVGGNGSGSADGDGGVASTVGGSSAIANETGGVGGNGSGSANGTGGVSIDSGGTAGSAGAVVALPQAGSGSSACEGETAVSAFVPVYMVLMYDSSGSMGDQTFSDGSQLLYAASRWEPMKEGLTAFFDDPAASGVFASLDYFPGEGDFEAVCRVAQYAIPAVGLISLDTPNAFIESLNLQEPGGGTPMLPALRGAVQYAEELKQEIPEAHVVVVLVTDGEPAVIPSVVDGGDGKTPDPNCPPDDSLTNTIEGVAAVAGAAYSGDPGIPVHVIGLGDTVDGLSAVASAGGTEMAFISDTDPAETALAFRQALEGVVGERPCDVLISGAGSGTVFDKNLVNVSVYRDNGSAEALAKAIGCSAGIGWEYDDESSPTVIRLCRDTCQAIRQEQTSQLRLTFGCETRVY